MDLTGRSAQLSFVVTEADTAKAVGSGSLPVLGTPRLIAWCEAATCAAIDGDLEDAATSVGTRVEVDHLAASPVGAQVRIGALVRGHEGRALVFDVEAAHADGTVVGRGVVRRAIVDAQRFLARLPGGA